AANQEGIAAARRGGFVVVGDERLVAVLVQAGPVGVHGAQMASIDGRGPPHETQVPTLRVARARETHRALVCDATGLVREARLAGDARSCLVHEARQPGFAGARARALEDARRLAAPAKHELVVAR